MESKYLYRYLIVLGTIIGTSVVVYGMMRH